MLRRCRPPPCRRRGDRSVTSSACRNAGSRASPSPPSPAARSTAGRSTCWSRSTRPTGCASTIRRAISTRANRWSRRWCARRSRRPHASSFREALVGVYLARQHGSTAHETTYLRFGFAGSVGEADPARSLDTGIVRTLWLDIDTIRERRALHRSPLLMRCIDDHAAGLRWPLDMLVADPSVHAALARPEAPPAPLPDRTAGG